MKKPALAPFARRAALALAVVLAPYPAIAQSAWAQPAAADYRFSKTSAILGGAPSRLAAILAKQSGQPVAAQPQSIVPAAYGAPVYRAAMPVYRRAIATDRPDVFGSVALPITSTPLDYRWRKIARGGVGAAPAAFAAGLSGRGAIERIEAVNRYVNAHVAFVNDSRQYGTADYWSPAAETLSRGKGDCEDYAIAKLQMLRRAGFADRDLYLVILKDQVRRQDHAVLVVRAEGHLLVLDNGTDRLIDSDDLRDCRPIMTFAAGRTWTHGYRRATPPPVIASAPSPVTTVTMAAASFAQISPSALAN